MKQRFDILDGMRGSTAMFVVMMHLCEANFADLRDNPLHHAFLGVDFFFMLSGFVVGYAYDQKMQTWTFKEFFSVRLVRLHPLVFLSIAIGALGYIFDPYVGDAQQVSFLRMLAAIAIGLLLIPSPALPNRYDETHSLNGPHWTLLQEYLANIVYGLIGKRISKKGLIILTVISGIVLLIVGLKAGQIFLGWGAGNIWMAPVRTAFPFFCGLLLFRTKSRIKIPFAYPLLTILLGVAFALPVLNNLTINGLYEVGVVVLVFPFIIAAGAGSEISGVTQKICAFFGRISYPIYITHYPFIYIYTHWVADAHPNPAYSFKVAAALLIGFIVMAYLVVRFYDEPVRAWLTKRYLKKEKTV